MSRPNDRINSALSKHGYTQLKKVGEGSFGAAILVQHDSDRQKDTKAIVKMIDISRASRQERDDALKESKVLSSLHHPYIVRYRESFDEDGWLCIVMDYCEGGDLSDRIKKMRQANKAFPEAQVMRWFTQSILALKYIHDMHILHRDLKSGNFFLSKSGNIKMGDFGIAKVLECTAACAQTQIGTPYYLSPEICQGKPYAWGSDIWSMGCILYEMCARKVPFDAPDLKSLIQKITKGPAPELPTDYSAGMKSLCKELLDRDASKRPPAAEILKKPVVREMVRRMLEEVKGEEDAQGGESSKPTHSSAGGGGSAGSAEKKAAPAGAGKYAGDAGTYVKGQTVEYYSETHGEWLPASVTNADDNGRVMLNVKPNVWLSLEVQSAKVRPKGAGGSQAEKPAASAAGRGSGGSSSRPRASAAPASNSGGQGSGRDPGSPSRPGRPSSRAPEGGAALQRQSSRDALPSEGKAAGGRHATPNRQPSERGMRAASPHRDLVPPPAGQPVGRSSSQGRR
mmetsp:Transcript_90045/g.263241  ORF Transcript_90045/g.263241 Transcript_90045/m.263241 type:complete len:511 (-) Transcript_90045:191-1723(-)